MHIETLKFRIIPEDRMDAFLEADEAVFGPWLRSKRGFLRKVPTVYPEGILHLRIYWSSKRDLDKAAKDPIIPALDVRLRAQFLGVYNRLP